MAVLQRLSHNNRLTFIRLFSRINIVILKAFDGKQVVVYDSIIESLCLVKTDIELHDEYLSVAAHRNLLKVGCDGSARYRTSIYNDALRPCVLHGE